MKIKKPIVRILIGLIIGLCAGAVADYASLGLSFPAFSIFGMVIGACVGVIVEIVRHRRLVRESVVEGKGPDLERLPISAVEFVKLVIKKMRYRKKVRADVMAELAAHFEDGVRECKTDEDKKREAQQLIADFGDVKLLGVLLRRAKKRCRPLWRTVIARACQAVDILFICFVLYLVWFLTGKPVITTNYVAELNRMVRPVADETLNAAPLYHKAAELYAELPEETLKLFRKKYDEATPEEKKLIEKFVVDNSEMFELIISGTQKPYYWQKYGGGGELADMMSILMPDLSEFRKFAYALCWRARLRAEQGQYEGAFDDMKSCYRFGRHLRGDKTLIEQLVGIAVEALAVGTLHDILGEYEIDSATLATLQKNFEKLIAGEDFTINFKAEKFFLYDEIQRCFTDGRFDGGHLYIRRIITLWDMMGSVAVLSATNGSKLDMEKQKPGWLSERISDIKEMIRDVAVGTKRIAKSSKKAGYVLFLHPNKQESREMADRYYAFWEKMAHKSPGQLRVEGIDVEKQTMEIIKGNILLEIFVPAIKRVVEISFRIKTETSALIATISILRYKQEKGDYPDSLDELMVAGYLKEIPMDHFSDKPLVYRKTEDNFILYSVGENLQDDGGEVVRDDRGRVRKWDNEGDAVFWPRPKPKSPEEREKEDRERRPMLGKRHIPLRKGEADRK